jgi:hypothetical protein
MEEIVLILEKLKRIYVMINARNATKILSKSPAL